MEIQLASVSESTDNLSRKNLKKDKCNHGQLRSSKKCQKVVID